MKSLYLLTHWKDIKSKYDAERRILLQEVEDQEKARLSKDRSGSHSRSHMTDSQLSLSSLGSSDTSFKKGGEENVRQRFSIFPLCLAIMLIFFILGF